jgi:hypothetical protein
MIAFSAFYLRAESRDKMSASKSLSNEEPGFGIGGIGCLLRKSGWREVATGPDRGSAEAGIQAWHKIRGNVIIWVVRFV